MTEQQPDVVMLTKCGHTFVFVSDRKDVDMLFNELIEKVQTQDGVPRGVIFDWFDAAVIAQQLRRALRSQNKVQP